MTLITNNIPPARHSLAHDQKNQFSQLMPQAQWGTLPSTVRRRFAKPLKPHETELYHGHIVETKISTLGLLIAHGARLLGGPLPFERGGNKAATVRITASSQQRGQCWTRLYERKGKFPHASHSFQRFAGKTGLEEYMGYGLGVALKVRAENSALVLESAFYFIQVLGLKIPIPSFLSIGTITLTHKAETPTEFSLTTDLRHPLFGLLIHQKILFQDYGSTHKTQ